MTESSNLTDSVQANRPKNQSLTHKVLIVFGSVIVFDSVFLLALLGLLEESKNNLAQERHARSVIAAIAKIEATMHSGTQVLIRQTLLQQTDKKFTTLQEFRDIFRRVPRDVKVLNDLL